jgi:hypothetical protein
MSLHAKTLRVRVKDIAFESGMSVLENMQPLGTASNNTGRGWQAGSKKAALTPADYKYLAPNGHLMLP